MPTYVEKPRMPTFVENHASIAQNSFQSLYQTTPTTVHLLLRVDTGLIQDRKLAAVRDYIHEKVQHARTPAVV